MASKGETGVQRHKSAAACAAFAKGSTEMRMRWILPVFLLFLAANVAAAPYYGEEFTYRQPDGATFQVRIWGDEYYAVAETLDGRVVVRDADTGYFCYANLSADGNDFVSSGQIVDRPGRRLTMPPHLRISREARIQKVREGQARLGVDRKGRSVAPAESDAPASDGETPRASPPSSATVGERVALVLLIEFPDRPGDVTISQQQVDAYCNEPGYTGFSNHGSVFDYFFKQSQGRLRYTSVVTAYYTAQHDRDYYTDESITYAVRARELIAEALNSLRSEGFDFSKTDGNGDGYIDGVNTFYAGTRINAWAEGLWPHRSAFTWTNTPPGISTWIDYQITDMTASLRLGTYCHENGHMLCDFPDLYDYGYESSGAGQYSLMANSGSSTWPHSVDPYLARAAGWFDTVALTATSHARLAVSANSRSGFRVPNPADGREYFLIHLLHPSFYDSPVDQGLLVLHCDEDGSNDNEQMTDALHYEMSVEQADGLVHLERGNNSGGAGDLFHSGDKTSFTDDTLPDARWWTGATGGTNHSGSASGLYIHSISAAGEVMTFVVGSGAVAGATSIGLEETALDPRCDFGREAVSNRFALWNQGTGSMSYAVATNVEWMTVTPVGGTVTDAADLVTVRYASASLGAGVYTGVITVTSADATNSPRTIAVVLTVDGQPGIDLDTNSISAEAYTNGSAVRTFTIANSGGSTLIYTNTKTQAWFSVSPTGGTVRTEADFVTLTFLPGALPAGLYSDTLTISGNATNSPQSVSVSFLVLDEPEMQVVGNGVSIPSGSTNVTAAWNTEIGTLGTFTSAVARSFGIANFGSQLLHLTGTPQVAISGADAAFFSVSQQPATPVAIRATNAFEITYAPTATGTHRAVVSIDSDDNDENPYTFTVGGQCYEAATLPFFDGFESGVLSNYWLTYSTGNGRIRLLTSDGPHTGTRHLAMDVSPSGSYALNEAILIANLAGREKVQLRFWVKDFTDEDHAMPASFQGHGNHDGVAISADGATWYRAISLTGTNSSATYQQRVFDLDAIASANGLTYGQAFLIKFQQYDNGSITADGVAFDDISLHSNTNPPSVPTNLEVAFLTNLWVAVQWSPSTDDIAVAAYEVWRNGMPVGSVAGTSFTNTDLSPSTVYTNLVRARDEATNYSAFSAALVVTTAPPSNAGPGVDAGTDRSTALPSAVATLNGTVSDDGMPAGITNIQWSLLSGPAAVNFLPSAAVEDPTATFSSTGVYVLALTADDGEMTNSDTVAVTVYPDGVLLAEMLDTDPGWAVEGAWEFGVPQGSGGTGEPDGFGDPDPAAGYTGTNVYGYNLAGNYASNLPARYLTITNPVHCAGYTNVRLSFRRWLGVEQHQYDQAAVAVSTDGVTWTNIWENPDASLNGGAWTNVEYDISTLADNQTNLYVRWAMGATDSSWEYGGWNIDDIFITAEPEGPVLHTLDIVSTHGAPAPAAGTHTNARGSVLTNVVTAPPPAGGTQFVCEGWALAGHEPASGVTTSVTMTVTNDAVLTWLWSTNLQFTRTAESNGTIAGDEAGWFPLGGSVTVTAIPDSYYHFDAWTGGVPGAQAGDNPLVLTMVVARAVTANFDENLAGRGTPEWWLASFGWTGDFDAAETNDPDSDRVPTWQECIANTDPTNAGSLFTASGSGSYALNGDYVIRWSSASNRLYAVGWSSNLIDGFSLLATNLPATPPENVYTDATHGVEEILYYRIRVGR